jgi:hypothetical protein
MMHGLSMDKHKHGKIYCKYDVITALLLYRYLFFLKLLQVTSFLEYGYKFHILHTSKILNSFTLRPPYLKEKSLINTVDETLSVQNRSEHEERNKILACFFREREIFTEYIVGRYISFQTSFIRMSV